MKQFTTIDNEQRVFVICGQGWSSFKMVCNLNDLVECCKTIDKSSPYKICHIFNNKLQACSRKYLSEMMEANQRPQDATYFKNKKLAEY